MLAVRYPTGFFALVATICCLRLVLTSPINEELQYDDLEEDGLHESMIYKNATVLRVSFGECTKERIYINRKSVVCARL